MRRLSYANVMSSIAVFIALGGTSYAAATLARNSVGSPQLKTGAVKTPDIAGNAVTSAKVRNGTIGTADLAPAVTAAQPVLRSGQTMRGFFAAGGGSDAYIGDAVTFPQRLPTSFDKANVEYRPVGTTSGNCPGVGQARAGWACLYLGQSGTADLCCIYGDDYSTPRVSHHGFRIYWTTTGGFSFADGSWAVTAP